MFLIQEIVKSPTNCNFSNSFPNRRHAKKNSFQMEWEMMREIFIESRQSKPHHK